MRSFLVSAIICGMLPACSTVDGVGRDIQAVGGGVSHLANEARDEMFGPRSSNRYRAEAGDACDPYGDELAGGGLPPCRAPAPPPTPRQN
ncbi:MAG: hypothetical protein QNI84_03470 [Henriciella sp.]|nr:hypothetical protein [Henriciella sp.]